MQENVNDLMGALHLAAQKHYLSKSTIEQALQLPDWLGRKIADAINEAATRAGLISALMNEANVTVLKEAYETLSSHRRCMFLECYLPFQKCLEEALMLMSLRQMHLLRYFTIEYEMRVDTKKTVADAFSKRSFLLQTREMEEKYGGFNELVRLIDIRLERTVNDRVKALQQRHNLTTSIHELSESELNLMGVSSLKQAGFDTLVELALLSENDLLKIKNVGPRTVTQLTELLKPHNLSLRQS